MRTAGKLANAFGHFATDIVAGAASAGVATLAGTLVSPSVAGVVGDAARSLVNVLLRQESSIERKLDAVLREPLRKGLILLEQGLAVGEEGADEIDARKDLLHSAHVSLTSALVIARDSREDSAFIQGLCCMALAARQGQRHLADLEIARLRTMLTDIEQSLERLQREASIAREESQALDEWLARSSHEAKPYGHMEQRILGKKKRRRARQLEGRAAEARRRFLLLADVGRFAEDLLRCH